MVEKKKAGAAAEETSTDPTAEELAAALEQSSNWEFIDKIPSPADVRDLLEYLPAWWGVKPVDYLDYVQALPSDKKIKVPERTPNGGTRKVERWFSVVTLYFSVAGRLQMCREAQERNGWRVDFTPEPNTPSGVPGFIDLGTDTGRIIYREYVEIWVPLLPTAEQALAAAVRAARSVGADMDDPNPLPDGVVVPDPDRGPDIGSVRWIAGQEFALLGRRPGMAWVPYTGGSQAKGSNPYEKGETAGRGRALAAWGFGVLPGSGVASYEEMLGVPANRQGIAGEATSSEPWPTSGAPAREKPEDLIAQILTMAEEARQLRGEAEGWNLENVRSYVRKVANVDVMTVADRDGTAAEIDLKQVKPAALLIVRNGYRERLAKLRDDQEQGN